MSLKLMEVIVAKALPNELREHALGAKEPEGLPIAETAARFMIGTASVKRWSKPMKYNENVAPTSSGGARKTWIGNEEKAQFITLVSEMSDATI